MKKSIIEAMEQARQHSAVYPDMIVRVMDKPRKHAVVTASEWIYRERVLAGWHTVATFKNGKELAQCQ